MLLVRRTRRTFQCGFISRYLKIQIKREKTEWLLKTNSTQPHKRASVERLHSSLLIQNVADTLSTCAVHMAIDSTAERTFMPHFHTLDSTMYETKVRNNFHLLMEGHRVQRRRKPETILSPTANWRQDTRVKPPRNNNLSFPLPSPLINLWSVNSSQHLWMKEYVNVLKTCQKCISIMFHTIWFPAYKSTKGFDRKCKSWHNQSSPQDRGFRHSWIRSSFETCESKYRQIWAHWFIFENLHTAAESIEYRNQLAYQLYRMLTWQNSFTNVVAQNDTKTLLTIRCFYQSLKLFVSRLLCTENSDQRPLTSSDDVQISLLRNSMKEQSVTTSRRSEQHFWLTNTHA